MGLVLSLEATIYEEIEYVCVELFIRILPISRMNEAVCKLPQACSICLFLAVSHEHLEQDRCAISKLKVRIVHTLAAR